MSNLELPSGFVNTGVICWLNSLLQALIANKHFTDILKVEYKKDKNISSCTHKELYNLLKKIDIIENIEKSSILVLNGVITDLQNKKRKIDLGFGQQSSSEGLTLILEMLNNKKIDNKFNHSYEVTLQCDNNNEIISKTRTTNNIFYLFDEKSLIKDKLMQFLLYHISELEENTIPHDYREKHIKGNRYSRIFRLKYIPHIVIISLNRYFTVGKNKHHQRNPNIKLPNDFSMPGINGKSILYKKISEIDHLGSLEGGHYISRCLKDDDNVYLFNDSHVKLSKFGTLPSTYLTFYGRIEDS